MCFSDNTNLPAYKKKHLKKKTMCLSNVFSYPLLYEIHLFR